MRKKAVSILLCVVMASSLLTGCTKDGGSSDEQVTINLYQNKSEIATQLQEAADKYMEENPNVKINVESIQGNDYNTNLKAKLISDDSVDIYALGDNITNMTDYVEDLSDEPWVEQAVDGSLEDVTLDGKVYGLPVSVEGYGLVYNKEIFKDAGIDASTLTNYEAIDKAFANLQEQIDSGKLKDKYPQLEAVEEYAAKETWIPGLHTLNVPLANEYTSATELRSSSELGLEHVDGLKALIDLETKYTPSKDDLSKLNAVDYSAEIGGGLAIERVAVVQQGNWIGPELKGISEEISNKMGMLPIPLKGVKEDCIATGISIYWCVNSQSDDKVKEASKDFLNWLFQSDEGKRIVIDSFGFVPAFKNYEGIEITDTLSQEVKRYIEEGKTMPWVMGGFPSGYEPQAAADIQGYFSGDYTFEQMIEKLKADFVELKGGN
ncbi:MAG: ABC transporter substrate-binding protein [Acetatifactor sp.]